MQSFVKGASGEGAVTHDADPAHAVLGKSPHAMFSSAMLASGSLVVADGNVHVPASSAGAVTFR